MCTFNMVEFFFFFNKKKISKHHVFNIPEKYTLKALSSVKRNTGCRIALCVQKNSLTENDTSASVVSQTRLWTHLFSSTRKE